MARASEQSVLGNFNNAKFTYAGLTSTFFKRDGKFFVNTEGRDGKLTDYEIKYTFGVSPLQQYLIEFPDGRLQALSIAGTRGRRMKAGSAGFIFIPTSGLLMRTSFTGRGRRKTGTSCAPTATRPTCARITMPPPINSRHAGPRSTSAAKPVMAPARGMWMGGLAIPPLQKGGREV